MYLACSTHPKRHLPPPRTLQYGNNGFAVLVEGAGCAHPQRGRGMCEDGEKEWCVKGGNMEIGHFAFIERCWSLCWGVFQ